MIAPQPVGHFPYHSGECHCVGLLDVFKEGEPLRLVELMLSESADDAVFLVSANPAVGLGL